MALNAELKKKMMALNAKLWREDDSKCLNVNDGFGLLDMDDGSKRRKCGNRCLIMIGERL